MQNTGKEILWQTHLKNASDTAGFEVRRMDETHFDQLQKLNANIMDHLANPDFYYPPYDTDLLKLCLRQRLAVGIFSRQELIAYQLSYFPKFREDNLGRDICLPRNRLKDVATFHGIAVHSEYKKNRFGSVLTECVLNIVSELGYRDVMATCHPDNTHSLRILLKYGFCIRELKYKYGGKLRYVLHKEVNQNKPYPFSETITDHKDILMQENLLRPGYAV